MEIGLQNSLVLTTLMFESGGRMDGAPHSDPSDPGSATQWGISAAAYPKQALRIAKGNLKLEVAVQIARDEYLARVPRVNGSPALSPALGFILFDNLFHGNSTELVGVMQKYLIATGWELTIDGYVGPKTADALVHMSEQAQAGLLMLLNATAYDMAKSKAKAVMDKQRRLNLPVYDYTDGFHNRYTWRIAKATALLGLA
jgi:lysozyme family protein